MSDTAKRGLQAAAVAAVLAAAVALAVLRPGSSRPAGSRNDPVHAAGRPNARPSQDKRSAVEAYLRSRANDPDSVRIQTVRYGRPDDDGDQLIWVQFREKNDHAATVFRDLILTLRPDGSVVHGARERTFLPIAHTAPWSDDPAGP